MSNINATIYSKGLVAMSVCAGNEVTREELTTFINKEHPTGLEHGWTIVDEPFADGTANPHPCENSPTTNSHYLFTC